MTGKKSQSGHASVIPLTMKSGKAYKVNGKAKNVTFSSSTKTTSNCDKKMLSPARFRPIQNLNYAEAIKKSIVAGASSSECSMDNLLNQRVLSTNNLLNEHITSTDDSIDSEFKDRLFITQRSPNNSKRQRDRMSSSDSGSDFTQSEKMLRVENIQEEQGRDEEVFVEPTTQLLGQQNPWSVQYPARLWDQGSINNSKIIREAEKRVMRLAEYTQHTLSVVYSGFSNINPNDFVENCHRSIASTVYEGPNGGGRFFEPIFIDWETAVTTGDFCISSANSSNVAILTAQNEEVYNNLLGLGQVPYLKYNRFTKEQNEAGILRIKSIKAPIITIGVTGAEYENIEVIKIALEKEYIKIGGIGTKVKAALTRKTIEFIRGEQVIKQNVYSGEIRLTIILPVGVDIELPTGPIELDLGEKGWRRLFAYQYGAKHVCKICGGNSCTSEKGNGKKCINRCKHCGLPFSQNHVENSCPKQFDAVMVENRWLVTKMEEDMIREKMPVVDISAPVVSVMADMESRKSSAWREEVKRSVQKQIKKVEDESKFGADHDINPYKDEVTREKQLSKKARRRLNKNRREGGGGPSIQERLRERVGREVGGGEEHTGHTQMDVGDNMRNDSDVLIAETQDGVVEEVVDTSVAPQIVVEEDAPQIVVENNDENIAQENQRDVEEGNDNTGGIGDEDDTESDSERLEIDNEQDEAKDDKGDPPDPSTNTVQTDSTHEVNDLFD